MCSAVSDWLCMGLPGWADRREDIRERFSVVKDFQKGGGAGNEAAKAEGCCDSSIVV